MLDVNRYNLFKSIETPTSGDHVECENSSFFLSSSFPPHPQEVQFIPQCMAFSLLWRTAASLPRQAASSPDEGFPPMCSLDERPLSYLDECPPLLSQWISSSQPPPYLNEQSPPSPYLDKQFHISFDKWPLSMGNLIWYEDAAWGLWSGVVFSSPVKSSFFPSKQGNWQPQPV